MYEYIIKLHFLGVDDSMACAVHWHYFDGAGLEGLWFQPERSSADEVREGTIFDLFRGSSSSRKALGPDRLE